MKDNIGFINKVKISIFKVGKYKELLRLRFSHAIIYSILLSVLVGGISGIMNFVSVTTIQNSIEQMMTSDEFEFEMKDGILDFKNSPIKREKGKFLVLINTNISLEEIETIRKIVIHKDVSVSILKDGISYRAYDEVLSFKYRDIPLFSNNMDNETILMATSIMGILKYGIFIFSLLYTYVVLLFNSFILSLVGVILSKMNNININYGDVFKLCIYAMTLPTLINLVYPLGSFSILISGIYLILAMNKIRNIII
ncbi:MULTISPECIES: DUF1189 family protein [unclassified Clostridium]|uniref:DUF1189 family protein n=1 Tax=unclassified Clostridium TaxID=2614128 RepID=UPI0018985F57|nr:MULTISPECIES: DUF1189 family protein [unclassified Clostridium]MCR1952941.1 DUF1189 domain-containing protein [Clostridium sp. DSM 100503]